MPKTKRRAREAVRCPRCKKLTKNQKLHDYHCLLPAVALQEAPRTGDLTFARVIDNINTQITELMSRRDMLTNLMREYGLQDKAE